MHSVQIIQLLQFSDEIFFVSVLPSSEILTFHGSISHCGYYELFNVNWVNIGMMLL